MSEIKEPPITADEDELAALRAVKALIAQTHSGRITLAGGDGSPVALPDSAVELLRQALDPLANRQPVEVHPLPETISVEDAAADLGRSVDLLMDQLRRRNVPLDLDHGAARISYRDFLVLKRRRDALNSLTQQGHELEPLLRGATVRRLSELA